MRLFLLIAALAGAFGLAVLTSQSPRPLPADAPATAFSATRALADVREIAQRPHPVGSPDHARVRAYLLGRMGGLGLQTQTQGFRLADHAPPGLDPGAGEGVNLIGVLPGSDPALPAVALMAHYDTTPRSPGAADNTTGVAAILEAVRAIRARGPAPRTVIVLFTDAEEIGLIGARAFFAAHPLRDTIGAVANLEARGGGGRAAMFETGRGNADTVSAFAAIASRVTGGVSSNSLSVFVYERMPNGTDFSLPKDAGVQGINLAFLGRPAHYHTPLSTPDNLDAGSVQHIGSQALEFADRLARAPALPAATADVVYTDVLGRIVLSYPPAAGWIGVAGALALWGFSVWRVGRVGGLSAADVGRGVLGGVWFLAAGLVTAQALRLLAGPTGPEGYYTIMARLGWLEAAVAISQLGLAALLLFGKGRRGRWSAVAMVGVAAVICIARAGPNPMLLATSAVALVLPIAPGLQTRNAWSGWIGLIGLGLVVTLAAQTLAPTTAPIVAWPTLLAALAAALSASTADALDKAPAVIAPLLATVIGGAWLLSLAHHLFLGIGGLLPGVVALPALLLLMLCRPLASRQPA
ncbi:M20/M25/M40 family metallo-hydrolase [Brevundimonas sp. PAMC22021]|uniref:M20/M25/M40 family metallo-hydrolase n=1 Tax=Brevundimonas sp. PAMC22021 TaxID=2861285 RepID=UPI001C628F7E|nr:M20/M25/M40 family metallo-hydrolase [Brevundimonas sp. PAMC22021]QYF86281.1 M20/M25/M40 family metallo-hydrolase [Brevundimonas sp. PAMC22021]